MFWYFRYSTDKDEFDKEKDKSFSGLEWVKDWLWYKGDNMVCHLLASMFFLYVGIENLEEWLGEFADKIPKGANDVSSAGSIGFFGSFIAEGIKKIIKLIKT